MAEIVTAPGQIVEQENYNIFLAGSTEMRSAENLQQKIIELLSKYKDINILNPRRDIWDNTWEQSAKNKAFSEQVNWELDGIEIADLVVFWFDPNTKSPISLLELGVVLGRDETDVIIYCPDDFWRNNVEVFCERVNRTAYLHKDQDSFFQHLEHYINEHLSFN